jgi:ethanolamine utilization protein EutA
MARTIQLVGLDCGSTTTSAVVARARLATDAFSRVEITDLEPIFRSEMVFTPLEGERLDAARLEALLDQWLNRAGVAPGEIFGGGALVTGLAAKRANADEIARLFAARTADAIVATADDPRLEAWLAFMGNCHELSRAHPDRIVVNLDVGGGTTNFAWGRDGEVIATGALFVGARHFQFVPGTRRLAALSTYGAALADHLQIRRGVGDVLKDNERDRILDFYLDLIDAALTGDTKRLSSPIAKLHVQAPPRSPLGAAPAMTLSGGVGQLAYALARGETIGVVAPFGDLGVELAARLARWRRFVNARLPDEPQGLGRATVYGLLRHGTELSGSTIYLPNADLLPLANVPILATITPRSSDEDVREAIDLAARSAPAACIKIDRLDEDASTVRTLGNRLADALAARPSPPDVTLVLSLAANLGKVLGNYATRFGTLDVRLIVVDQVPDRDAQFVRLGRMREGVVPVSLYGMR